MQVVRCAVGADAVILENEHQTISPPQLWLIRWSHGWECVGDVRSVSLRCQGHRLEGGLLCGGRHRGRSLRRWLLVAGPRRDLRRSRRPTQSKRYEEDQAEPILRGARCFGR